MNAQQRSNQRTDWGPDPIEWRRGLALAKRLGGWRLLAVPTGGLRQGPDQQDLRDYAPGDDYRQVDWWLAARRDELLTRCACRPCDVPVYLLLDCSASMGVGSPSKWNLLCHIAGQLAWAAIDEQRLVRITAFGRRKLSNLPSIPARISIDSLVRFLGEVRPEVTSDPKPVGDSATILERFAVRNQHRGVAILLSDLFDVEVRAGLAALRRQGYWPVVIQIFAQQEADPACLGDVELLDVEQGDRCAAVLSEATLVHYRRGFARFLQHWRRYCLRWNMPCLQFSTASSCLEILRGLLLRQDVGGIDGPLDRERRI